MTAVHDFKDSHVKFARCVWLAVGEEAKQRPGLQVNVYCRDISFFRSIYNKTIIRFGFCDKNQGEKNQGLGKSYITLTSTLIILDITRTSSNNCLKKSSEIDKFYFSKRN